MIAYWVERYDALQSYENGHVLALTPAAALDLSRAGVSYSVPEDFYRLEDLRRQEEGLFQEQLEWLVRLDRFFGEAIPSAGERGYAFARACYLRLKYLIDFAMIQAYGVSKILDVLKPERVVYVGKEEAPPESARAVGTGRQVRAADRGLTKPASIFHPLFRNRPSYTDFLSSACAARGIELVFTGQQACERTEGRRDHWNGLRNWLARANRTGRLVRAATGGLVKSARAGAKSAYRFFVYRKWRPFSGEARPPQKLKLLFLDAGSPEIDAAIADAIRRGHRVLFKEGERILELSGFWERGVKSFRLPGSGKTGGLHDAARRAYERAAEDPALFGAIRNFEGLDVSRFMLPYLQHFTEELLPEMIAEAAAWERFYREEGVDFVVARASSSRHAVPALVAARAVGTGRPVQAAIRGSNESAHAAGSVKNVCIQHGCLAVEEKVWYVTELDLFDYYFTANTGSRDYFEAALMSVTPSACHVTESSHVFENLRKKYPRRKRRAGSKKTVLYVPKKLPGYARHFHNVVYPMMWYFRFQKELVDMLARRDDCEFIYKHQKDQFWAEEGILRYLREKGYSNIRVESGKLAAYVGEADRVLLDYPSTGFFEAACLAAPVMALYEAGLKVTRSMQRIFGRSLQSFASVEEALRKVTHFLDGPAGDYVVNLPLGGANFAETLEEAGRDLLPGNSPLHSASEVGAGKGAAL
jgi:hypothetical protein